MHRSNFRLLVRLVLGLVICVIAWSKLRPASTDIGTAATERLGLAVAQAAAPPATAAAQSKSAQTNRAEAADDQTSASSSARSDQQEQKMEQATFGGGCFWCVEAVLQRLDGVEKVVSGYAGGKTKRPTYEQVCTGRTGHAEVVQITYDPSKISYVKLLEIFMKTHDPTTLNRQGNDVGDQYRSVILTHNEEQARQAAEVKEKLETAKIFSDPIVTFIEPLKEFYAAEEDHQNYFDRNPTSRYCQVIVKSKVEKLEKFFSDYLKSEAK